nr:MAB_1171c family putative transporter [Actinokineospora globicatena]
MNMFVVKTVVYSSCAVLCFTALGYRITASWRNRRDPAVVALIVALLAEGLGWVLAVPNVAAAFDDATGVPNLAVLLMHVLAVGLFTPSMLVLLVYWSHPPEQAWPRARRRIAYAVAVSAALVALWVYAAVEQHAETYLPQNYTRPPVALYTLVYVVTFGAGLIEIFRMCVSCARRTEEPWLRRGLRLTALGALCYLSMCVNRISGIVLAHLGLDPLRWEWLTPAGCGSAILFIAVGLTLPSWGPRLAVWVRSYRTYRTLYPLWVAIYRAVPHIALEPPPRSAAHDLVQTTELSHRLYRRVIEIRDGLLVLRSRLTSVALTQATRTGDEVRALGGDAEGVVAASQIRAALRAPVGTEDLSFYSPSIDSLHSEIAWLVRVSECFVGYPWPGGPAATPWSTELAGETTWESRSRTGSA